MLKLFKVPGSLDRSRAFVDKWMAKERKKDRLSDEDGELMLKTLAYAEQPGSEGMNGEAEACVEYLLLMITVMIR
jgi:hypothetical protein